ncbi:hypothetical protein [Pantoea eucalypti]|uniref:hypothetical protein n=2 Tax=Pantoea eucalypti TaxID=470933 RepID=UPI0016541F63|nr:hypothetical protein [Pantoea eucalypti]
MSGSDSLFHPQDALRLMAPVFGAIPDACPVHSPASIHFSENMVPEIRFLMIMAAPGFDLQDHIKRFLTF